MGKQKAHKKALRQARETKEVLKNGGVVVATTDPPGPGPGPAPTSVALMVVKAPVAVAVKESPTPAPVAMVAKAIPITKAGVQEYNDFFGLYAKSIREKKAFRPLGFIPGPAVLISFREGEEVQITVATTDVARGLKTLPTPWMKREELPEKIRQALDEWQTVISGMGREPSPYNLGFAKDGERDLGFAQGLRQGKMPNHLAMAMPHFRYRPGDPELPFGVVLIAIEGGMRLERAYNPKNIPDVPAEGTVLTIDDLRFGKGAVQKLINTWSGMEDNFLRRYTRWGERRNGQPQPQTPNHKPTL